MRGEVRVKEDDEREEEEGGRGDINRTDRWGETWNKAKVKELRRREVMRGDARWTGNNKQTKVGQVRRCDMKGLSREVRDKVKNLAAR